MMKRLGTVGKRGNHGNHQFSVFSNQFSVLDDLAVLDVLASLDVLDAIDGNNAAFGKNGKLWKIEKSRNAFGTAHRPDGRLLLCDLSRALRGCGFGWRTGHAPCTARKDGQGTPCPYNCQQEISEHLGRIRQMDEKTYQRSCVRAKICDRCMANNVTHTNG